MARRKQLAPCVVKGCPTLTRETKCEKHSTDAKRKAWRESDKHRPSAAQRGYDAKWQKTRRAYLAAHPYCEDEAGCIAKATDVHHLDGLGPLGPRGHDFENCLALCHAHHSKITSREQAGGWNVRAD